MILVCFSSCYRHTNTQTPEWEKWKEKPEEAEEAEGKRQALFFLPLCSFWQVVCPHSWGSERVHRTRRQLPEINCLLMRGCDEIVWTETEFSLSLREWPMTCLERMLTNIAGVSVRLHKTSVQLLHLGFIIVTSVWIGQRQIFRFRFQILRFFKLWI